MLAFHECNLWGRLSRVAIGLGLSALLAVGGVGMEATGRRKIRRRSATASRPGGRTSTNSAWSATCRTAAKPGRDTRSTGSRRSMPARAR
jgi:hypothetical protein